ncbi:Serine palmitoyltransferase small subunit B [Liparis tanakae]|uniref:Serine palmitoyltransferase small subunit B n=1 Tax=Liparis tanakae TaxID=230148 RepID=A0A4Z2IRA4_9TELE|nr:Serine palmitoyltransferase small subunit B [Liparis tanakae]
MKTHEMPRGGTDPDVPLLMLSVSCARAHTHTLRGPSTCVICEPARKMIFKSLREYLAWLYYQYLLITGIYVLEPWEKSIFSSILFSAIAMAIYTSYVFVPIHVRLALEFFSGISGVQPESTVALMT